MVDDGLQRDGHVADVVGLHSDRPSHQECSGSATHERSTARAFPGADLQLQLLDSSGEATAASDFRITAQSTGWRRDGAPRGATELDALASCPNFVALQIQLLARINSSRRENRWKMSPDVPP